jgi:hypothetical protein
MPLAAKLFKLSENLKPELLLLKLKGFRVEWEDPATNQLLVEEIRDATYSEEGKLRALVVKDKPLVFHKRGEVVKTVRTLEVPVVFDLRRDPQLVLVLAKKRLANEIAVDLSKIVYGRPDAIVEAYLSHEAFRRYFETKMDEASVVYFDNVDLPNVDVLALYGESLKDSSLYHEYLSHGKLWYVVVSLPERGGLVVGLTRNCIVTAFGRSSEEELVSYVFEEVVELLE